MRDDPLLGFLFVRLGEYRLRNTLLDQIGAVSVMFISMAVLSLKRNNCSRLENCPDAACLGLTRTVATPALLRKFVNV